MKLGEFIYTFVLILFLGVALIVVPFYYGGKEKKERNIYINSVDKKNITIFDVSPEDSLADIHFKTNKL